MPNADDKVQKLIAEAADPAALVSVLRELEYWLKWNPADFGESRYENVRVAFTAPLGVEFEILEDPPTVIVMNL
ncbi:MAG: hypothetical protein IT427_00935 [Pirellulales bacterium]|nr:hypothetical protein [Pirellulales bacterium]